MSKTQLGPSAVDLPWLPRGPNDQRAQLLELKTDQEKLGEKLRFLANQQLTPAEAVLYGKRLRQLRADGASLRPLASLKIAVLSNSTFDLISTYCRYPRPGTAWQRKS